MTRTAAYKALYVSIVCGVVGVGMGAVLAARGGHVGMAVFGFGLIGLLLLPGRILAHFWSDLLAGLHYLNQRDFQTSKAHSERFLTQLEARPWLKRLIWLGTSTYSRNAEVLALNNLGAAELGLGEFNLARRHLSTAIALDPKCPLPYRNMGSLVLRTGAYVDALPWFEKASALGLNSAWSDRMVMASQRRNASLSTIGTVLSPDRPAPPFSLSLSGRFIVQIVNDDAVPFDFVISAIEQVFGLTGADAVRVAVAADRDGQAECAAFESAEAAHAKADQLASFAVRGGYPLLCIVKARSEL
jgi:ATP-dependent Clp protease adapter protein ClpS